MAALQIRNLATAPAQSFTLSALISDRDLREMLEYLAALLLLLSLLVWAIERF